MRMGFTAANFRHLIHSPALPPPLLFIELRQSRESEARSPHTMQLYPRQPQVSASSKLALPRHSSSPISAQKSAILVQTQGTKTLWGCFASVSMDERQSVRVPQGGSRTASACTEISLHSCSRKGRGRGLWSKASLRMFLQISSIGEYSAKTCHATGKSSWTLDTSCLLLVVECVGSWPAWIKGFLIKGSLVVS